ncbi:hypothetical protein Dvina_20280 [Dactylosporangium vinaceum]|uniref:Uncharacterized protein n=1 Tax=Dactylosporangium vinaceum TaxID=53362 RepID=A0ABV5MSA7_9ACTN|nr:hypothetical protein [Dactylosporangium vinaceum]UAC00186.1 hypothetical protein Dvina_20280 [Dactylosporangium vinaceum]
MTDPHQPTTPQQVDTPRPLFTFGVDVAKFASWARILVQGYTWQQFTKSPGFEQIRWDKQKPADQTVAELADDPTRVYGLAKVVLERARKSKHAGESHYQSDAQSGHRYTAFSGLYPFLPAFAPWLADGTNNNVFRLMLSCFPPYGRQVPTSGFRRLELVSPDAINTLDDLGDMSTVYAASQRRQLEEYNAEQWAANSSLVGRTFLGRSGTIHLSNYGTITNTDDKLVVRYALASTDRFWHVFDGRVLWVHVTDLKTNEMMYFGIGGGSNKQSFYNGVNGVTGAFVFGGMMSMMHYVLKAAGKPEMLKVWPGYDVRDSALKLMGKEDIGQFRAQYAANLLDVLGTGAAAWRLFGFRQVTGGAPVPTITETE